MESVLSFANSIQDTITTFDGLGRPHLTQRRQKPAGADFDSVQTDYDALGRAYETSAPYVAADGAAAPQGTACSTTALDALGRPTLSTDAGGATANYTHTGNDTLVRRGPAPQGENPKQVQYEVDGLGQLRSVCEITSNQPGGGASCGQTAAATGFLTAYTRNTLGKIVSVEQNAQSSSPQTRSFQFDDAGRLLSETNPESGTTQFIYDSVGGGPCTSTSAGDLVERTDADGTVSCYSYDPLHRVTAISYSGGLAANTPPKVFIYDSAANATHAHGRLAEAYTGTSAAKITDEVFGYTALGQPSDFYELTPHSGGWLHSSASYAANGAPATLSLPGVPLLSYTTDGEGRVQKISAASGQNPLTNTLYNASGAAYSVALGNGTTNQYTYDPATGRMTQYQFQVAGGQTDTGAPSWNTDGSLGGLTITDNVPSGPDSQTCTYLHDDLGRLTNANCGTPLTQNFSFDTMGNLTKTGGGYNWNPGYDAATNRALGSSYDADGNPTSDGFHTYSWNADGAAVNVDSTSFTVDALGRTVEASYSWGSLITVFTPAGAKGAVMNGAALDHAYIALPGGSVATYGASGLTGYRSADWLGSDRLDTDAAGNATATLAYGAYGETYASWGSGGAGFTGQYADTVWSAPGNLYDFPYRRYSPSEGRWLTPDPAGRAAADPANPQTWDRYAYVGGTPLTATDPLGLILCLTKGVYSNASSEDACHSGHGAVVTQLQSVTVTAGNSPGEVITTGFSAGLYSPVGLQRSSHVASPAGQATKSNSKAEPSQPESGCTPLAADPRADGVDTFVDGFTRLTHPLDMLAVNGGIFVGGGGAGAAGIAVVALGCLEPTPFEPLTCATALLGGSVTTLGGGALIGFGAYFFGQHTLPAIKKWGCER